LYRYCRSLRQLCGTFERFLGLGRQLVVKESYLDTAAAYKPFCGIGGTLNENILNIFIFCGSEDIESLKYLV
jgi:hypothetical protein